MSYTTNVLLVIVIILLVAVLFDAKYEKSIYAQGAAASDPVIFAVDSVNKETFLINIEKSIILQYKTSSGVKLKSARKFDYDVQLDGEFYKGSGASYTDIIKRVKLEGKKKK